MSPTSDAPFIPSVSSRLSKCHRASATHWSDAYAVLASASTFSRRITAARSPFHAASVRGRPPANKWSFIIWTFSLSARQHASTFVFYLVATGFTNKNVVATPSPLSSVRNLSPCSGAPLYSASSLSTDLSELCTERKLSRKSFKAGCKTWAARRMLELQRDASSASAAVDSASWCGAPAPTCPASLQGSSPPTSLSSAPAAATLLSPSRICFIARWGAGALSDTSPKTDAPLSARSADKQPSPNIADLAAGASSDPARAHSTKAVPPGQRQTNREISRFGSSHRKTLTSHRRLHTLP